ncbi:MAG: glycosyltransferase [Betaproteobacteria bacterium]|nr:MAG: glycosyltransferase [Betaproteobacteria bacterium]
MAAPKLSIVLPTYNRAAILGRAITSALAQTERDIELIVVDDGSTDGTEEFVHTISDARLRYLRYSPNRGGNHARNRGIEAAGARIVSFLDSDDELLPQKATVVLDFFTKHPEIDGLLDSHVLLRDDAQMGPRERKNPDDLDPASFRRGIFQGTLSKPTPAISARKKALLDIGMFDERLRRRQDLDLLARLSRNHACASISTVLWRKHWVEGAISAERGSFVEAMLAICDRHPEYVERPDFRIGLERDVVRHFAELAAGFHIPLICRDIARLRRDGRIRMPPLRLWRRGARIFWRALVGPREG